MASSEVAGLEQLRALRIPAAPLLLMLSIAQRDEHDQLPCKYKDHDPHKPDTPPAMSRIPHAVGPAAAGAADVSGQGEASTLTSLSDLLIQSARTVRVNSSLALRISHQIRELVAVVTSELESHPDAPWAHSEPLKKVEQVLTEICAALEAQGKKSYLAQLLRSERDRAALVELSERVRDAFNVLMIHMRMEANALAMALAAQIETLAEKHATDIDGVAGGTVVRCPPAKTHYFGRASETDAVVTAIIGESPGRVAILGGPGMGKSTLSVAVLHDRQVVQKFGSRRYFVSCDSADCGAGTAVTMAFGIPASDPKDARKRLQRLLGAEPSLLVLDNFEAVWEASERRADAEDMLRFLDSIGNLSLIVTLRGNQRPDGLRWSRPFVAPLTPLADAAARQTFLSISDISDDDRCLGRLLSPLDGIPLAIVLMACLAQYESPQTLLSRWNELHTAMIVRGQADSRQTSLDVSIQLSVLSPRMAVLPAAQSLLSILALLPYGVVDTDLPLWKLNQSARALAVLSQNSLIVCGTDHRVRVLAPIRSFMASYYPPTETAMRPVFDHYFGLAGLSHSSVGTAQSIASVAPEVGNIGSLALYALQLGQALRHAALTAVKDLCSLYAGHGIGSAPDLVASAVSLAKEAGLDSVRADLLVQWGRMSYNMLVPGNPRELWYEARLLYEALADDNGVFDCAVRLADFLPTVGAIDELSRLYRLAEAQHDLHRMAHSSYCYALTLGGSGKLTEAKTQLELAITHERQAPDSLLPLIGTCQRTLSNICLHLGDETVAMLSFEEAITTLEAEEDAQGIAVLCGQFATHLLAMGRTCKAIAYAQRGLELQLHSAAGIHQSAQLACTLASAHACSGNPDAAKRIAERVRNEMQDISGPALRCEFLLAQADISLACGNTKEAHVLLLNTRYLARERVDAERSGYMDFVEITSMENLVVLEPCLEAAVTLAVIAAIWRRQHSGPCMAAISLLYLAEVVDDTLSEQLVDTVLPTIQRMRWSRCLAIAHLRRAHTAQRRGQHHLATQRAQNALRYFGDFVDVQRIARAKAIIEECSPVDEPLDSA